ncbi:MAG: hypothetical protein AAGH70_14290 [Pseudomonadota bacterium]
MIFLSLIAGLIGCCLICYGTGRIYGRKVAKLDHQSVISEVTRAYSIGICVALFFSLCHLGAVRVIARWLGSETPKEVATAGSVVGLFGNLWLLVPLLVVGFGLTWVGYEWGRQQRAMEAAR